MVRRVKGFELAVRWDMRPRFRRRRRVALFLAVPVALVVGVLAVLGLNLLAALLIGLVG